MPKKDFMRAHTLLSHCEQVSQLCNYEQGRTRIIAHPDGTGSYRYCNERAWPLSQSDSLAIPPHSTHVEIIVIVWHLESLHFSMETVVQSHAQWPIEALGSELVEIEYRTTLDHPAY